MKGPGMRIELDVSRIWRCPACGREVGTRGMETARRCTCSGEEKWMELVEPLRRPRDLSDVIAEIHQGLESNGTATADEPAEDSATAEVPNSDQPAATESDSSFGAGITPEAASASSATAGTEEPAQTDQKQTDQKQAEPAAESPAANDSSSSDDQPPAAAPG